MMSRAFDRWSRLDRRIFQATSRFTQKRVIRWVAWLFAHSGDSQWWFVAGAFMWWQATGVMQDAGNRIVLITLGAGLASSIIKWIIRRPRPENGAGTLYLAFDRHSFPSGHATRVVALSVVLAPLLSPLNIALLILWALLVAISRIALQAHYASDVLGGMLLGLIVGLIGLYVGI